MKYRTTTCSIMQSALSRARGPRMTERQRRDYGHDSGREIVAILEKNPKKGPSKYGQDDINHMRKVIAYCERHLAQEGRVGVIGVRINGDMMRRKSKWRCVENII